MATGQMNHVLQNLRWAAFGDGVGRTDADLLEQFVREGDEVSLAVLVRRHAPMVWGVCRRILSSHHDAEDAFQASFLVLVRKAAAIQRKELLANWLYGVAQQTAVRARAAAAKRGKRERQVSEMPEPAMAKDEVLACLEPLLDQELSGLPEKYRTLIVLCDLEGKTRKETAQQLGLPEGTVAGRLARARALLAKRLARRGVNVTAGALGAALSAQAASAAPTSVVATTIHAAALFAAGQTAAAGVISAQAVALSEGVMKTMLMCKLKLAALMLTAIVALALGGGAVHFSLAGAPDNAALAIQDDVIEAAAVQRGEQPKDGTLVKGKIGALDTQNRSVTLVVSMFDRKAGEATETEKVFNVPKDAVIIQDGVAAKLEDLKKGWPTTVKVNQKDAVSITVEGSSVRGKFKSTNPDRNTITVIAGRDFGEKVYHLLKTTKVLTVDGKAAKIQELQPDAEIVLTLSVLGDNTVIRIQPPPQVAKKRGQ